METQASNSKASKSLVRTKQRSKRDQRAEVRAIMLQRARTPTTWLKLWWLSRVLRPPLVLVYIQNILSVSFFSLLSPSNIPISSSLPPQFLYLVHTLSLQHLSFSFPLSISPSHFSPHLGDFSNAFSLFLFVLFHFVHLLYSPLLTFFFPVCLFYLMRLPVIVLCTVWVKLYFWYFLCFFIITLYTLDFIS